MLCMTSVTSFTKVIMTLTQFKLEIKILNASDLNCYNFKYDSGLFGSIRPLPSIWTLVLNKLKSPLKCGRRSIGILTRRLLVRH